MMLSVDEIKALHLFVDSQSRVQSDRLKEAIAAKDIHISIKNHPCDLTVGFSTRREFGSAVCTASAIVFDGAGTGFFGSASLRVNEAIDAAPALNTAIEQAIEQAKVNPAFQAIIRSTVATEELLTQAADFH